MSYLNAARKINNGHIPVWFMRQAGRYLPEYREVKSQSSFRVMSHTPELMCEITMQPLRRYHLDAAIMFSDILTCLEYMGSPFKFTDSGPQIESSGPPALTELTELDAENDMPFIGEGIQKIKNNLSGTPLIGFVGAPFTLASYLVEGGTSKDFAKVKHFMLHEPTAFHSSMDHLTKEISKYMLYQIASGVNALQIFDSWVGVLSEVEYATFVFPYMKKLIANVNAQAKDIPITLYSQPTLHLLPMLKETGADVLSVDWRSSLDKVNAITQHQVALQGNLDPIVTTLTWDEAKPYVDRVLQSAKEAELLSQYIFNVGHGVTPQTNPDTIKAIVDYVHEYK